VEFFNGSLAYCNNACRFTAPPTITAVTNNRAPFDQTSTLSSVPNTWLTCVATDTDVDGTGFQAGMTHLLYDTSVGDTKSIGAGVLGTPVVTPDTNLSGMSPTDDTLTTPTGVTCRLVNPDGQYHDFPGLTWEVTGALPNTDATPVVGFNAECNIAINPTNPLNACVFAHNAGTGLQDMRLSYTLDGGLTWNTRRIGGPNSAAIDQDFLAGTLGPGEFRYDPTCGFDDFGNFYLAYGVGDGTRDGIDAVTGGPGRYWLIVGRSPDGGAFLDILTSVPWPANEGLDRWVLDTGPDGNIAGRQCVYVCGMDLVGDNVLCTGFTNLPGPGPNGEGGAAFFLNAPSGLGYEIVNDVPNPSYQMPSVAVGPNGETYVSWMDFGTGDIWVDVDLNGVNDSTPLAAFGTDNVAISLGATLVPPFFPVPAQPDRGYQTTPMNHVVKAGPNAGRVMLTYSCFKYAPGTTLLDTVAIYSDDDGASWSAQALVHPPALTRDVFHPWLDTDPVTGYVYVTYYDTQAFGGATSQTWRWSASSANGATWGTPLLLSQLSSDVADGAGTADYLEYNGVAVYNRCVYAAWADNSTLGGFNPNATGSPNDGTDIFVSLYMQQP
jgi:hypothetical protein